MDRDVPLSSLDPHPDCETARTLYLQPMSGLCGIHPKFPGLLDLPQWQRRRIHYPMTMFRPRRVLEHDLPGLAAQPGTKSGAKVFEIKLSGVMS
jgi:hypothetical protein